MKTESTLFKIRQARINKNYTQAYIAEELGISPRTYNDIENGRCKLSTERLIKIAEILETPIAHFFEK